MDLKDFFSKEKGQREYFWSLVLEPGWVQAAVWTIVNEKAQLISVSTSTPWQTDENLIDACDTALSSAVHSLPEDIGEPSRTVFGLSSNWIENGNIKQEHLSKIKGICTELSLEPTGFVVLSEAISHFYKSEEGSPISAVIVGIREEEIELSLFRLGSLSGTASVARSVSLADDIIEGLSRFSSGGETFPSRFLIYDGKEGELEEMKQNLLSFNWGENQKIKFLHTPKIEIVSPEKKVMATSLAGASEISNVEKIVVPGDEENVEEGLGDLENVSSPETPVGAEELGFVVDEDVVGVREQKEPDLSPQKTEPSLLERSQNVQNMPPGKTKKNFSAKVSGFTGSFGNFFEKLKLGRSPAVKNKKNLIFWGLGFFLLLLLIFASWWFLPKAVLTIYVSPKQFEEKFEVTIDPLKNSDFSKGVISGDFIETEVSGEKTVQTTGKKKVGEKAKGSVKIQNGTSSAIKLQSGSVLTATNDLKFTIDTSASVSAAISPSLPGEGTVEVTAYDIGAEYNLGKDEVLKVANYLKSEVDAVVTTGFSGGSSREISSVSQEDQDNLLEDLKEELLEKAVKDISNKVKEGDHFIDDSVLESSLSKTFSNKVGDEAANLKLNLSLSARGVVVESSDFYDFVRTRIDDKISSGYVLRNDQLAFKFKLKESDDEKYLFEVTVNVNLLPQIETESIKAEIKGKSEDVVYDYFTTIPGFIRAEVKYETRFLSKFKTIPHMEKNIDVVLSNER